MSNPNLIWRSDCDNCKQPFPREHLVLVLPYEGEVKHLCAHCLLYFLGDFLRKIGDD